MITAHPCASAAGPANACCSEWPVSPNFKSGSLPSGWSLLLLPPRVLSASVSGAAEVVRRTFAGDYPDVCSICHEPHDSHQPCCTIPETVCPNPCVCRIHWTGCPGDSFQYRVQITNVSKKQREYTLTPQNFHCTEKAVTVAPTKKTIEVDESFTSVISFTIPESFAGGSYVSRVTVKGAYEQYVLVCLDVRPKQFCCCHIEQGERPKMIKAHHWYHHFQCETECPDDKGGM